MAQQMLVGWADVGYNNPQVYTRKLDKNMRNSDEAPE
jgi:hypothetical protein